MKKTLKLTALLTAFLLTLGSLTACSEQTNTSSFYYAESEIKLDANKGTMKTWGNISVLVPHGMTLTGGSASNAQDLDFATVTKKDNTVNYILFIIGDSEDDAKSNLETTRSTNDDCKDITLEAGTTWKGVSYTYSGMDVLQLYSTVNGRIATVQCCGFTSDSEIVKAMLSSLKLTKRMS